MKQVFATQKKTIAIAFAVLLAIILFAVLLSKGCSPHSQKTERLHGTVEVQEIRVAGKIAGRVEQVLVRQGDRVQQGDVLFSINSPEVAAKLAQAKAVESAATAMEDQAEKGLRPEEIEMIRLDWQQAKIQQELAESTFKRMSSLHAEGLIPTQQYDEVRAKMQASREQARAAKTRLDLAQQGARTEEQRAAQAQREQASAAVEEVQTAENETIVYAPIQAEVAQVLISVGELAPAGYPVVTLADPNDQWVMFNVREDRLAQFQMGKGLMVQIPALNQQVEFRVSRINALPDFATWRQSREGAGYDLRTFQVEAKPNQPVAGLRAGMTVIYDVPIED
ncbi:MAG: efflux RND transporter periplasmic adaptor subunit [Pseudomonadota bacterium]|nr:efflux RND transporter periplasmic adaptor subunit [Pseudomonadota bacterium]